jgi:site-specific recombinase
LATKLPNQKSDIWQDAFELIRSSGFMTDLNPLLGALNAQAPLAQRHLWLVSLLDWLRGDGTSPDASVRRLQLLLDALQSDPLLELKFKAWWAVLADTVDITTLLADFGFAPRTAFLSELGQRIRRKLLPMTPETSDAADLFELALDTESDAAWLTALDEDLLQRLAALLHLPSYEPGLSLWQHEILDAITYCASQVRSIGFAPEMRLRMAAPAVQGRPFHALAGDAEAFRAAYIARPRDVVVVEASAQQLRERLEACRQATTGVYSHLEDHGISVGLVFRLRQMRKRIVRIRELMDCLLSSAPLASSQRLIARLANLSSEERSIRALITANSSLLAAKVAERSAETGEHYITRDRAGYRTMLRKAAGGGAFMSITTLAKFALMGLSLSVFWSGLFASLNYAFSFVAIQLLHWTVATKQPAMTAPAMAAKLQDVESSAAMNLFVDEVTHLMRSQVAAVIGNLALVVPCVLAISAVMQLVTGQPMITQKEAHHVLDSLTLLGPMAIYAAFTGILLFVSSIIAGWVENWFVLHRLDSALRYNPRITTAIGPERAHRWASFWRINISGFASNISLGLMLGLIPAFAVFFGIGLEVRHVTLSTGQITAAVASLGESAFSLPALWWCVAAIPVMAFLNLAVSFYCAFRVALAANSVSAVDRGRIRKAIWTRFKTTPWSFLWPSHCGAENAEANT